MKINKQGIQKENGTSFSNQKQTEFGGITSSSAQSGFRNLKYKVCLKTASSSAPLQGIPEVHTKSKTNHFWQKIIEIFHIKLLLSCLLGLALILFSRTFTPV